jgi:ABC-type transport system substrate-binding protein
MRKFTKLASLTLAGLVLCLGCAQPATTSGGGSQQSEARTTGPKRLTAAIRGNPHTVYQKLNPRSNIPGIDALQLLVNTGLTVPDPAAADKRLPRLAEQPATVDNGNWKLNPDGSMELTWNIRPDAVWHDGTPLTPDDLAFTLEVWKDKRLPIFSHVALASVDSVQAAGPRTVVAKWNKPYIKADEMFSSTYLFPIAKHKLNEAYQNLTDQEQFIANPYWSTEFVGLGPYKLKTWEAGSFLTVTANDAYVGGRPKIDEVTVKFIPDPNTLGANILAGEVDVPWGGRIDLEWAQTVTDQWRAGKLATELASMLQIYPQHINPTPAVVLNTDFKRAMVHALDRQAMGDELNWPGSPIGHSFIAPTEPEYSYIESAIVKYDYDTRKSLQILEGLGYTRQSDGFLHDASGAKLAFQIRTSQGDVTQEKAMYAVADSWQKLGVDIERHLVVPQRAGDAEYRATYPAFDLKRQAGTMDYATSFHTRGIALPENNFLVSGNNSRYSRPEMDAAIDKYFTTIPWNERMEVGKQIVNMLSADVGWIGLWHLIGPNLVPDRVTGMRATNTDGIQFIHEWDVK